MTKRELMQLKRVLKNYILGYKNDPILSKNELVQDRRTPVKW